MAEQLLQIIGDLGVPDELQYIVVAAFALFVIQNVFYLIVMIIKYLWGDYR